MFQSSLSEADRLPLATLPLAFQKRLAKLAYIPDLKNLRKTCPEINHLCRDGARDFDQIYFTDDEDHFVNAKYYLNVFKIFQYLYICMRTLFNDFLPFRPTWKNICNLTYVEQNRNKFYVTDTVVLYCGNSDSYDKFIPSICGPYTRISIRGKVRWDQVKRLIHPNVKEVQILAKMDLNPDEFDEFVAYIEQHLRGKQYKFAFSFYPEYTLALAKKVQTVCRNHKTHCLFLYDYSCMIMDRNLWKFQSILLFIMMFSTVAIPGLWTVVTDVRALYVLSAFFFLVLPLYASYFLDGIATDSWAI